MWRMMFTLFVTDLLLPLLKFGMAHLGCVKELHFVAGLLFTFLKDTLVLSHIFEKGLSNLVARSDGSGPLIFLQF